MIIAVWIFAVVRAEYKKENKKSCGRNGDVSKRYSLATIHGQELRWLSLGISGLMVTMGNKSQWCQQEYRSFPLSTPHYPFLALSPSLLLSPIFFCLFYSSCWFSFPPSLPPSSTPPLLPVTHPLLLPLYNGVRLFSSRGAKHKAPGTWFNYYRWVSGLYLC